MVTLITLLLGILVFVVLVMFYGITVIHDIPYEKLPNIAITPAPGCHSRGHWVSLFIPACALAFWIGLLPYRPDRGWGFNQRDCRKTKMRSTRSSKEFAALQACMTTCRSNRPDK